MVVTGDMADILYQSPRTRITRLGGRGRTEAVIRKEGLDEGCVERIRRERGVLARLAGVAGIPALVAEEPEAPSSILMADVGGVPLPSAVEPGNLEPAALFQLAHGLAEVVARVHARGVVHKDLNPNNVLLVPDSQEVVLIDFDLATTFAQERPAFTSQREIGGTLPYLAPEQTGRTARPVDHRADLYAVGAMLYHLAVGEPPFGAGDDPLQLIHDHLARIPVPPQAGNPAVPASLSQIILRLLEKEPDRRYQSAQGLVYDLDVALRRWTAGTGESFLLGERDFPLRLSPPGELIGREFEITRLAEALDRAVAGELRGVLLAGPAGVGKTSLMNELRQVVTGRNGWLASGKFDQYQQGQAGDAIAQSIGALGLLLLAGAESEAELAALKTRVKAAVGPNAGILVGVVPELAHLLDVPVPRSGADPTAAGAEDGGIDPFEAERRLYQAGLDLLRAVVSPSRPLVLIVDDLQWGTSTPLGFLDLLLKTEDLPGLLVVAAYRDGEVDATHPLTGMLARWRAVDIPPEWITVANLPPNDVEVLLTKMLRLPSAPPSSLVDLVRDQANGNPFDTVELVNALRRDDVLSLGPEGWIWDETAIDRPRGTTDITDLVNTRIDTMPAPTITLLETMSLLGDDLPAETLRIATGTSGADLAEQLRPALEDGLLIMESGAGIRLAHDRVREAALARLGSTRVREVRLGLARALAAHPVHRGRAAEHYLAVVDDLTHPDERQLAAGLLHQAAGRQALASPGTALTLLDAAIRLLDREAADGQRKVLGELQAGRHTALYRLGRLEEADEAYQAVCRYFPDVVGLVPTAANQINSLCNRGLHQQAMDLGMDLLARLGIERPPQDLPAVVSAELDTMLRWLETADPETENARPVCTDPRVLAIAQLSKGMGPPAFFVDPMLAFWLALLSFRMWSTRGPCPANYGNIGFTPFVVMALRRDYHSAMRLLEVIMGVGRAHGFDDHMFVARFHALFIEHWFHPVASDLDKTRDIHTGSLKVGEIQNASFANVLGVSAAWESYATLEACRTAVESALAFARRIGDRFNEAILRTYLSLIDTLRSVDAATADDATPPAAPDNPMTASFFHVNQALRAALMADLPGCVEHAAAARALVPAFDGHYPIVWAQALHALATAQRAGQADPAEVPALLEEVDECLGWLRDRAEDNPDDLAHLAAWITAERAAALQDFATASQAFDEALGRVRRQNRVWHQALILERAGRYHVAQGLPHIGELLLAEAWRAYRAWGAAAKTEQLADAFPAITAHLAATPSHASTRPTTRPGTESLASIDLLAVLRASQTLSLETNFDRLQDRIVNVLGALTGATDIRLLLWNPESRTWMLFSSPDLPRPVSLEQPDADGALPLSVLRFVDRTRAPLLVDEVTTDARFSRDPYFADLEQCSLLVVPIQKQGQPLAMLLLENRLSSGALSADRLDTMQLISGQLATSIDNALAERFRSVVQHSSDLTLVCNSRHVLTYASAASADLLATSGAALPGRAAVDLFHADDRSDLAARLDGATRESSTPLECRIVSADGSVRWVEVAFTDLLADPAVNGVVLRLRDITERRKLETELRHSQKIRSVGVLASGIAHEINTPVQYVLANLRFLSDVYDDLAGQARAAAAEAPGTELAAIAAAVRADTETLVEDVPQAIAEALEGVTRVATIVQAMKSFGHPESDKMTRSDLNDAVRNTVLVATNEIKYIADVDLDLTEIPLVDCILGDIKQVLLNLIVNAAHAVKQAHHQDQGRGTITIRSRQDGDDVVIEVHDDGTGIGPDIADRVFEQFFTTKEAGVGTGQGLSLAYSLVHDRHHGTLTFTSEVGVGTTFSLRLPVRQPART